MAQLVRASDRHAADAGSIPRCGKGFFFQSKDPTFSKMYQLEIFREDEQRITSLTFGSLVASKMATGRKQGGEARSDFGS